MITKKQIREAQAALRWTQEIPPYDSKKDRSLTAGSWFGRKVTLGAKALLHIGWTVSKLVAALFLTIMTPFVGPEALLLAKWCAFTSMRHLQYTSGTIASLLGIRMGRVWMHRAREHIRCYSEVMPSSSEKEPVVNSSSSSQPIDVNAIHPSMKEIAEEFNKFQAQVDKFQREQEEKEARLARANAVNMQNVKDVDFSKWADYEIDHLFGFVNDNLQAHKQLFSRLTKKQLNEVVPRLMTIKAGDAHLPSLLSQRKEQIEDLDLKKIPQLDRFVMWNADSCKYMTIEQKCYLVKHLKGGMKNFIIPKIKLEEMDETQLNYFIQKLGNEKAWMALGYSMKSEKIIPKLTSAQLNGLVKALLTEKEDHINAFRFLSNLGQQTARLDLTQLNVDLLIRLGHAKICEKMTFEQKLCLVRQCEEKSLSAIMIGDKLGLKQMSENERQTLFEAAGEKADTLMHS